MARRIPGGLSKNDVITKLDGVGRTQVRKTNCSDAERRTAWMDMDGMQKQ